jgi:hypothetical protein
VTSFSEQLPLLKQSGYVLLHKCASRNKWRTFPKTHLELILNF